MILYSLKRVLEGLIIANFFITGSLCYETVKEESGLEFCEGHNYFHASRSECPAGISFGERTPPTCICLRGIYRAYMDNCEIVDGFSKDVCMLPYEKLPGHTEKDPKLNKVRSIQFLGEPNWDETHVLLEGQNKSWNIYTEGADNVPDVIPVASNWFYMVNGQALISVETSVGAPQIICVEPLGDILGGTKVCKVTKAVNPEKWIGGNVTLKIRRSKGCWLEGGDMNKLKTEPCMKPLMPRNDECSSKCVREGRVKPPTWPNCPAAVQSLIWDNEYLERRLKQYIILTQVNGVKPIMDQGEPKRTMELYQSLLQITTQFCPTNFVKSEWLTWMTDLFYLLHKGNRYKYAETITGEEFSSTKKILDNCLAQNYQVRLTNFVEGMTKDSRCHRNDFGPAVGYCKADDPNCLKPIRIDPINEKMEHRIRTKQYVPEVAWNILDAVQAICFREFTDSYRMFHVLQQAVEKLFTNEIKNFWYHPPSNHKERLKTMISGKGAEERIGNLEICIGSAYHILNSEGVAKFGTQVTLLQRLARPPLSKNFRRRRSISGNVPEAHQSPPIPNASIGNASEVYCRFSVPAACNQRNGLEGNRI